MWAKRDTPDPASQRRSWFHRHGGATKAAMEGQAWEDQSRADERAGRRRGRRRG